MNDRLKLTIAAGMIATLGLTACQKAEQEDSTQTAAVEAVAEQEVAVLEAAAPAELGSGIDTSGFDTTVRPQDDYVRPSELTRRPVDKFVSPDAELGIAPPVVCNSWRRATCLPIWNGDSRRTTPTHRSDCWPAGVKRPRTTSWSRTARSQAATARR